MIKRCHSCKHYSSRGKIMGFCTNPKQSSSPELVQKFNGCDNNYERNNNLSTNNN